MAYKKNWQSKECTIEEGLSLLRMVAQEYTNHRYTVRIITDDGGSFSLSMPSMAHTVKNLSAEIETNFMGWRTVWFQVLADTSMVSWRPKMSNPNELTLGRLIKITDKIGVIASCQLC